jgi:hypothetical protein
MATNGRLAISFFVAVLIAAFITLGMSAPAQAVATGTLKVRIANKAGELLTGMSKHLAAVSVVDGVRDVADSAEPVESPVGTYTFNVLPGSYAIGFIGTSGTISELYSSSAISGYNQVDFQQATLQPVNSNEVTYLDFSVISSVGLKGTVTGPTNHAAGGINVEAYRFDGTNWIDWQAATTNSVGVYSFAGLDAGSYKLEFTDYSTAGYLDQFSGGGSTLTGARSVYIPVGGTATVNAKLATGGRLTGKATYNQPPITPANEVLPFAYPVTVSGVTRTVDKSKLYFGAPTGSNGVWTVAGLPTGTYIVKLLDDAGAGAAPDSLVNAYVGPTGPVTDADLATVFSVTVGHTTTAPGSTLMALVPDPNPTLTIQVNDPDGHALPNASVSLTPASDNNNDYSFSSFSPDGSTPPKLTDVDGQISAGRIPEGDYVLSVDYDVDRHPVYQPYVDEIHYAGEAVVTAPMSALTNLGWSALPYPGNLTTVGSTNIEFDSPNQGGTSETRQWERDGVPILGATSQSYTAAGGDIGKTLSVVVTLSKPGFPPVGYTAFVGVITVGSELVGWDAGPAITSSVASPVPGSTLYATSGTWMADSQPQTGVHATITWWGSTNFFASSTQLGTGATYVVKPTDAATKIRAEVVAQKPGYTDSVPSSTNIFDIGTLAAPTLKTAPKITATKLVGGAIRYTTTPGVWSVSGLAFTYTWSLGNGLPTTTVPANSFTYLTTDHPEDLYVTITATKTGYVSKTISARASTGTTKATTSPGKSGLIDVNRDPSVVVLYATTTVHMGDTLSVDDYDVNWDYPNALNVTATKYQWYRQLGTAAPVAIPHATASSYVTTPSDVGAKLSLIASSASSDYPVGKSLIVGGTVLPSTALISTAPAVSVTGPNTGPAYVPGGKLTGTAGSWGITGVTQHAQWFICKPSPGVPPIIPAQTCTDVAYSASLGVGQEYVPISNATSMSYTSSLAQAGEYLVLAVTGSKTGYANYRAVSPPLQMLDAVSLQTTPFPFHGHAGITGAVQVGKAVKATLATPDVAGATIQTQWLVCASDCSDPNNFHLAGGAGAGTSTTYTPTVADYGTGTSELEFAETFTKTGYGASGDVTDSTAIVTGVPAVTKATTVTVTTTTDTVVRGSWNPAGGQVSYDWFVNGDEKNPLYDGAPSRPRNPAEAALPIVVIVKYSPTGSAYQPVSTTFVVQRGAKPATVADQLNGNTFGTPLQLVNPNPFAYPGPAAPTFTWQWYVSSYATKGAVPIKGATSSTYSPPASYVGKYITATITSHDPNWNNGSVSAQVKLQAAAPVTGTQQLTTNLTSIRPGATVKAATAYPSGTTFSYQWAFGAGSSTPVAIPGATHSTYVVLPTQAGGHLQVTIIARSAGHNASSPQVVNAPVEYSLPIVGLTSPTITGLGIVGSPLGVNVGLWNTSGLSFSYQWEVNGIPIPGATGATFTPLASEWTDAVDLVLTAKKTGYVTVTVQTPTVQIGLGAHPVATTLPKITGTLTSGHTITVSTGTWNVDGLTFSYAWSWSVNGVTQDTSGPEFASSSVSNASAGTYKVVVTASRAGYADGTATTLTVIVQ